MTLTDSQYKTLLDAQAIARHVMNTERLARNTAMNCASGIQKLIDQLELIEQQSGKAGEVAAPY